MDDPIDALPIAGAIRAVLKEIRAEVSAEREVFAQQLHAMVHRWREESVKLNADAELAYRRCAAELLQALRGSSEPESSVDNGRGLRVCSAHKKRDPDCETCNLDTSVGGDRKGESDGTK